MLTLQKVVQFLYGLKNNSIFFCGFRFYTYFCTQNIKSDLL